MKEPWNSHNRALSPQLTQIIFVDKRTCLASEHVRAILCPLYVRYSATEHMVGRANPYDGILKDVKTFRYYYFAYIGRKILG